ncbi:MAG TPA: HisA/HisF-related TIM barrel protein, partial [Chitinophagaceae bacterium]|nr:HisA/HisF-related TIM barrel protein [Chitinophagaceae bacterium]
MKDNMFYKANPLIFKKAEEMRNNPAEAENLKETKELQEVSKLPFRGGGVFIIPAIDIIEGKCVRLTQGDYAQKKIYNEHPLEVAKQFEDVGLMRLHLVDLDGAKVGTVKNWKVLETIASKTSLIIDFGGGIKKEEDVKIVFNSGAMLATIGSMAIKNEEEFVKWLVIFGADKFLLG